MAAITICSDFGALKNKVWHCFHCFPFYLPWSDGTKFNDHNFLNPEFQASFFTLLSLSSRGSLASLHFLSLEWYHVQIWVCWCFSRKSWFQLVIHISWHFYMMYSSYKLNKQGDNATDQFCGHWKTNTKVDRELKLPRIL